MLIFPKQKLVYFAVPKTGTTAFEVAVAPAVAGSVVLPQDRKHMNVRRFERNGARSIGVDGVAGFERLAVLREPLARLASWYRYRRRLPESSDKSTVSMSFADFIEAGLRNDPPPFARTGDQWIFATRQDGSVGIDHLFTVENPLPLVGFLGERMGSVPNIPRRNVSEPADTSLPPPLLSRLRTARAAEFALYESVAEHGYSSAVSR